MKYRIVEMMNGKFQVQSCYNEDDEWVLPFVFELQRTPVFEQYEQAKAYFDNLIDRHKKIMNEKIVVRIHNEIQFD
jgi:hypothetical protein